VPPKMPRRTRRRIGREQRQEAAGGGRGGQPAGQPAQGVEVGVAHPQGKVHRLETVIHPRDAEDGPGGDGGASAHGNRREIRVGGADPAPVIHGDAPAAGDRAGKGHRPAGHRHHRGARRCRQIDAPVPVVGADRGEGTEDLSGDRKPPGGTGGGRQLGDENESKQAQHGPGPRPWRNLAAGPDRWQGAAPAQAVRRTGRAVGRATCSTKAANWRRVRTSYTPSQTVR